MAKKGKGLGFGPVKVAAVKPSGAPTKVVAGGPGRSFPQTPIAGPKGKGGPPPALRKALKK